MRSRAAPSGPRGPAARLEQPARPAIARATSGSRPREQLGREARRVLAPSRSASSRAWRGQLVEALGDHGEVGAGDGLVEADHDVAGLDAVAVADPRISPTTPPVGCCTFLTLAVDDERARARSRRRRARSWPPSRRRRRRGGHAAPPREARWRRIDWRALALAVTGLAVRSHRLPMPADLAVRRPRAPAGTGRMTLREHLVLGAEGLLPASAITRIWSTPASALGRWAITTTMPPRARTPEDRLVSACSPSVSRLEFGSSSTTRNGSP